MLSMTSGKKSRLPRTPPRLDLEDFAGNRIRRLQQIAVATFMQDAEASVLTPVQFAVLYTLAGKSGIDQKTLARSVGFDTSTIGSVIDRLESRGLLARSFLAEDRRVRLLNLTREGAVLIQRVTPSVVRAQARILEPLTRAQSQEFMKLVALVIAHHEVGATAVD